MRLSRLFGGLAVSLLLIGGGCASSVAPLAVGDNVFAEWTSQKWYSGTIDKTCDLGFNVAFDESGEKCVAPDQIIRNVVPKEGKVKVGTKVIAKWTGTPYYDAEVTSISDDVYTVTYYDGAKYDVSLSELRLDPNPGVSTAKESADTSDVKVEVSAPAPSSGIFSVGTPVEGKWVTDGSWYGGMISKVNANGTFDVKWDDGTTQPGTAASSVRLKAGTAVEARWNGGSYWSGKVTKANSNGTYDITWDSDGTMQKNTPLGDLKLK